MMTSAKFDKASRVLLFSHRNIYEPAVWRGAYREFESIIEEIDAVDVMAPNRGRWFRKRKSMALRFGEYCNVILNPGIESVTVDKPYELFFVVCEKPSELLSLKAVNGWESRCGTKICWLTEFYEKDIPAYKSALNVLSRFDHLIFSTVGSQAFRELCPGRIEYLPPAVDTIRFCPYPLPVSRCIDVLSIGRRSPKTHGKLLQFARSHNLFYVYDTIKDLGTHDVEEHRFLLASLAKRSRYFIVNPGKIDRPDETGGQSEFGQRYFEGLAAGTVLIGERPRNNKQFDRIFDWPDATIHLPYGAENIDEMVRDLDKDSLRLERIRNQNIAKALAMHDWAYRWEEVLKLARLEPTPKLLERKQRIADLMKCGSLK